MRRRPRFVTLSLGVVGVAALGTLAAGWHYASVLLTPATAISYDDRVVVSEGGTVRLADSPAARAAGTYGLAWVGGFATVGPPTIAADGTIARPLVAGPTPPPGPVALTSEPRRGDPRQALGLEFSDLPVPDERGEQLPVWYVRGTGHGRLAIIVHGRGVTREEGLRIAGPLHASGLCVQLASYRNDDGAPRSPDGYYHLGDSEWRDLDAVVRAALARGEREIVLVGFSTGGAIVEAFLDRADPAVRNAVHGVILDSPVLDWRALLDQQARNRGLPTALTAVAERVASARAGIDWNGLDVTRRADHLLTPRLVIVGTSDTTNPIAPARRLASARPDIVTLLEFPGAGHVRAWNVDPARYERAVRDFVGRL